MNDINEKMIKAELAQLCYDSRLRGHKINTPEHDLMVDFCYTHLKRRFECKDCKKFEGLVIRHIKLMNWSLVVMFILFLVAFLLK